jgi:single-stranded-DNA-specific exonuclease
MAEAVDRLVAAREAKQKIAIVGDYDVDGVTATAQLLAVFAACGIEAQAILPHRMRDGYGFQPVHVERARNAGCALIVTADCGSSSIPAIEAAGAAGLDVIVTDHHLPGGPLPPGTLQINPRQSGCDYPFPDLAAAGIALKLSLALGERLGRKLPTDALLRIACLGTIADLVPLRGENRVIAALGLKALETSRSPGLKALIRQAGMKPPYSASDIGFRIGPRLNAAGRLAEADPALEILMSRDERRAIELALQLDGWNRERQSEEAQVVEQAQTLAQERVDRLGQPPAIFTLWSPEWHRGVVGIAAGRIARIWNRPTLLLAVEGETATGSGRSVPGIALHGFLAPWKERLIRFGGHAQALGLSADLGSLAALREEWEEAAASAFAPDLLARSYRYELEAAPQEIDRAFLDAQERLAPFGQGNPQPVVRVGPLELAGSPRFFGTEHLSARACGIDGGSLNLVGWGWQPRAEDLLGRFEVLGTIDLDRFLGEPVIRLIDARPSGSNP